MPTVIDGTTGITTSAIDLTTPLPIAEGGTALSSAGSAGNVLTSDGTNWTSASKLTSGTLVNTTSGTTADFTGIPSWVKNIKIVFNEVVPSSTTNEIHLLLGTASQLETTGYVSTAWNSATFYTSTIAMTLGAMTQVADSGIIELINITGNTWIMAVNGKMGTSRIWGGGGSKSLTTGALTRLQVKTTSTDTFTSGSINIFYA